MEPSGVCAKSAPKDCLSVLVVQIRVPEQAGSVGQLSFKHIRVKLSNFRAEVCSA